MNSYLDNPGRLTYLTDDEKKRVELYGVAMDQYFKGKMDGVKFKALTAGFTAYTRLAQQRSAAAALDYAMKRDALRLNSIPEAQQLPATGEQQQ